MCASLFFKVAAVVFFASVVNGDYYWRPWTPGSVPSDAITGRDYRGNSYIVQAYVPNWGLFVGQAFISQAYVNVSASNSTLTVVTQSSHDLKVLCVSDKDKLVWYPSSRTNLPTELLGAFITPVVGGLTANDQVLYVGRYVDAGARTVNFGSVGFDYRLNYQYNRNVVQYYYEILIVNGKCNSNND